MSWARSSLRRRSQAWTGTVGSLRLADKLGRGAHGTVWRAWNYKTREWVAVKLFSGRGGEEGAWRFMREQRLTFDHPSIIAVRDFGSDSNGSYLVTELLPGGTLEDYIAERGALAPDLVLTWGEQLFDALAVVVGTGVVHRDVKPANLMLRDEPDGARIVLADFGQAWIADGADLTSTPGPVGTAGYIAPELGSAHAVATTATDVYAASITLRRALTGGGPKAPFPESTPRELIDLLERLGATDPRDRPSPKQASEAFAHLREDRLKAGTAASGRARAVDRTDRTPDPYLRRKIAVGAAVLVLANAIAVWVLTRPAPPPGPRVAASSRVAWRDPTGPTAISDDGTMYAADKDRGVIYRVTNTALVPVAGGGTSHRHRGKALDISLSSALRFHNHFNDTTDLFSPIDWQMTVDAAGDLWLNTGEIWRIRPGGDAVRVLAVPAEAQVPVQPYSTSLEDPGPATAKSPSVFATDYDITAEPSHLMPREDGVDFFDQQADRIAHVDAGGRVTTACALDHTHRSGRLPEHLTVTDDEGRPATVLLAESFVVVRPGDCWVADRVTGEVAHVEAGKVTATFYGAVDESKPGWQVTQPENSAWSRPQLLGRLPNGSIVIALQYTGTAVGLLPPRASLPTTTVPFMQESSSGRLSLLTETPGLDLSEDGQRISSAFTLLSQVYGKDPRTAFSGNTIAVFDAPRVLAAKEIVLPRALERAHELWTYRRAAGLSNDLDGQLVGDTPAIGLSSDQLQVDGSLATFFVPSASGFVASLESEPWIWRFGRSGSPMALLAALTPPGVKSGSPGACSVQDVASSPDRKTLAVLCDRNDDEPDDIVAVRIGSRVDPHPRTLASSAAFRRAARSVDRVSGVKSHGIGPELSLSYTPEGRLVLFSGDEKGAFEVTGGELHALTSFRPEKDKATASLLRRSKPFQDDPVRVRVLLDAMRTDEARTAKCTGTTKVTSGFSPRSAVALDAGKLLMAFDRCLVLVTPRKGTEPFSPGVPSDGLTRLAAGPDAVLAYSPLTAEIWRYSLDGRSRDLVAGHRLLDGVSPDGAKAAGSPIGKVVDLLWSPNGQPCFRESSAGPLRCVDERGALETVVGKHVS